ncbi:MAG: NUDIX hydrolase [Candidatus Bathyarchaeia archaeon]
MVEHPGTVAILPLKESGKILLVRQFRSAVGRALLELPAGTREDGEGEAECAKRELAEETGYSAEYLEKVLEFYLAPGYSNERLGLFVARQLKPIERVKRDPSEAIKTFAVGLNDALNMIGVDQISDAKAIFGLLCLASKIKERSFGIGHTEVGGWLYV